MHSADDDANAFANVGVVVVRLLNFYKNWSKVEFPTNLRNKAAPPPPGGHPSTTTWNLRLLLLVLVLSPGTGRESIWGVEANTDAVC